MDLTVSISSDQQESDKRFRKGQITAAIASTRATAAPQSFFNPYNFATGRSRRPKADSTHSNMCGCRLLFLMVECVMLRVMPVVLSWIDRFCSSGSDRTVQI
jgi:hypothetical protein